MDVSRGGLSVDQDRRGRTSPGLNLGVVTSCLLTVLRESQPATRLINGLRVRRRARRAPQDRRHGRRSRDRAPSQTRPRPVTRAPPIRLRDQAAARLTDSQLLREVVDRDLETLFLRGNLRWR